MTKILLKNRARTLRTGGDSMKEIAQKLHVSLGTVSLWVRDIDLSTQARRRVEQRSIDARKKSAQTLRQRRIAREGESVKFAQAMTSTSHMDKATLYMLSAMIYECEGGKNGGFGVMEFTNSDPELVKIFLALIRKVFSLDESKFRVVMHLHSYHNEEKEKIFWSHITGIPKGKFLKTFHKKESGIQRKNTYRGCVQIKYFDVNIKRVLLAGKHILLRKLGL